MRKILLLAIALLPILAKAQCSATFTSAANPQNNNLLQWSFTNNSTVGGGPSGASYEHFNFGDGASAYTNPGYTSNHTYSSPGTYTASLVVTTYDSTNGTVLCSDSQAVTITVAYPACAVIVSDSQTTAPYTLPATFDFYSYMPGGSGGYSYSWSFGDGTSGTGSTPSHTYTSAGTYNYCLTVSNGGGCSYTSCGSITTTAPPSCVGDSTQFWYSGSGLSVYFSAYPTYTPTFTNTNTWNFGDGGTGTGNYLNHTYSSPGNYTVTLTTTWGDSTTGTVSCTDTFTSTVNVINSSGLFEIGGNVCYDSTLGIVNPQFKVWLIQFDPATNLLTAIDSTVVADSGGCAFYDFNGLTNDSSYLVKAQWINNPGLAYGLVPTYSYSQLSWSNASQIYVNPNGGFTQANIFMLNGTPVTGPGFVGGNVSYGANKGTNAGVPNLLIVLRDAANNPVLSTFTDMNGNYTFNGVPNGTYSVYPEKINYATIPYNSITVNAGNPTATLIDFHQDDAQMNIAPHTEGIANIDAATVSAYPNPAGSIVNITVDVKALGNDARYELTMLNGQIAQGGKLGGNKPQINVAALSNGMYFLHVSGSKAQGSTKLVVQHP